VIKVVVLIEAKAKAKAKAKAAESGIKINTTFYKLEKTRKKFYAVSVL
jgi:hypothetical protein